MAETSALHETEDEHGISLSNAAEGDPNGSEYGPRQKGEWEFP